MIAYLKGTLALKNTEYIIIDVRDVGYKIEISSQTFEQLPAEGKEIKLLIFHHFTDSAQRLFGFYTADEKRLFQLLITVKGVGPKLGLTILSGLPAAQIIEALVQQDKAVLTQITGIGKKTAERMILELKDKIEDVVAQSSSATSGSVSGDVKKEAISALRSLGINKGDAQKAVRKASQESDSQNLEQLLKKALNSLNN
ncbi:MAG TPA: Holliday junction branch migration protein RuvA [Balneolaceae bacterium]|nr:Holliday junction branch migration protein RuvA [Balneolaceae bacterium]